MRIPARHLRAHADDLPGNRHRPTDWDIEQQTRIVNTATALFVRFGRTALTMHSFAQAMRLSPTTIRRYFADLDSLLAEILIRHLMAVSAAIGETLRNTDNPKAARRAAYVAATRNAFNAHTQRHELLLRERHALPPDLLETIDQLRQQIGAMLAGPHAEAALALLDEPTLQPPQIEAMLATLTQAAPQKAAPTPASIAPAETAPASTAPAEAAPAEAAPAEAPAVTEAPPINPPAPNPPISIHPKPNHAAPHPPKAAQPPLTQARSPQPQPHSHAPPAKSSALHPPAAQRPHPPPIAPHLWQATNAPAHAA